MATLQLPSLLFLFAFSMVTAQVSLAARIKDFDDFGLECKDDDLHVSQAQLPSNGIPRYTVLIVNSCTNANCSPSDVHLHCGWFASARLVNPNVFQRLDYDDCILNGGKSLKPGQVFRFVYTNTFKYPLSLKSAHVSCESKKLIR